MFAARFLFVLCLCLSAFSSPALAAALEVCSALPQGEVRSLTQITVRFSENMRPLGVMEESADASPLKIHVPDGTLPAGNFRWQDPATLGYLFDTPVQGPYRFELLVPAGTKALSGNALAADRRWAVNTPPIDIKHSLRGGVLPPKGGELYLSSNHALRLDDLTAGTRLMLDGKSLPLAVEKEQPPVRPFLLGQSGQTLRTWRYRVKILAELPPGKDPLLTLAAGVRPVTGSLPAGTFSFTLPGYRPLQVQEWRGCPAQGPEKDEDGKAAPEEPLYIRFNNPVRYKDLLERLSISPDPPELEQARREAARASEENDPRYSAPSTSHSLAFSWKPRTTYSVTLRPGLRDVYDTILARESRHSFSTGDYRPFFSLPHGLVLEAASGNAPGGALPLTLRNCNPVDIRLRFLPWGDNPARVFDASGSGFMKASSQKIPDETEKTLRLDFSPQPNATIRKDVNLQNLAGPTARAGGGLFALRVTAPRLVPFLDRQSEPGTETHSRAFQITDLGLTVKMGRESSLAWVSSLSAGQAVAGAALSLYGEKSGWLWQGTTDDAGLASLPGRDKLPNKEALYLKASKGRDAYVQVLEAEVPGLADPNALPDADKPWNAHVLAQLPLYQPGQTVRFTLYARVFTDKREDGQRDTGVWRPIPAGERLSWRVGTAGGQEVRRGEGPVNAYGSLSASFTLPQTAELGAYSLTLQRAGSSREVLVPAFGVASFRPPDFKVDVTVPASQALPAGDAKNPLPASVSAAYFSGASLAGAQTVLRLSGRETAFVPPRLAGYAVGDGGQGYGQPRGLPWRYEPPQELARLNAVLDASGKAAFSLPSVAVQPGRPRNLDLEATVTDQSGLTSQGAAAFLLHPSRAYVGLKAPFLASVGKPVNLDIKAAAVDDKPITGVSVTLRAERRKQDGSGYEAPDWENARTLTRAEGERVAFLPRKSGLWRVSASIKDAEGRENLSTAHFYVTGPDMDWGGGSRGALLELLPDAALYEPGATARVVLKNPAAREGERYWTLISLEREGVRESRVAGLSGPAPVLELPLSAKDAPYVYLSVAAVTGRSAPAPDPKRPGADNGAPRALLATVRLNVREKDAALRARLSTDAASYRPGGRVRATLAVRDSEGAPVKSQVTLLAVDERFLRAAGDKAAYDPSASFSPLHALGVRTQDSRQYLADLGLINLRRMLQPAAAKTLEASGLSRTAGLTAPDSGQAESLRENFAPDVFWLAQQESGDDGAVTVSFTLPDTLTTHRIVAVATDRRGRFATASASVTVFKPLQLLSALPRFVTEGDTLYARVLAQNLGAIDGELTLTAEAFGLTLENTQPQRICLKAGSSAAASFKVTASAPGKAELRVRAVMNAAGQREEDAARFTLPVLPAAPLTTVAAAGLLKEGEMYRLPVRTPAPLDGRSRLNVIFAPSPAAGLPLAAQSVLDCPWHSLEQRLSLVWVRALRLRKGEVLGLQADPDDRKRILESMASVPRFQKADGGFALWQELRGSDLYLTAYALLVNSQIKELRESGVVLPPEVEKRALRYLAARLESRAACEPDVQAVALWLLSRGGASAPNALQDALRLFPLVYRRVMTQSGGPDPLGLSALLLAVQNLSGLPAPEDKEKVRSELVAALEKNAVVTATQLHFASRSPARWWQSMGSGLRDNGLALWALTAARPDYPRLEALAFWLSQGLGEKKILSTQEAMFGLAGLCAYLEHLDGDGPVSLKAVWNGRESVTRHFTRLMDAPQRWVLPAAALASGRSSGLELKALAGKPYWTARLVYASPSLPVRPENAGFTLTRVLERPGPYRMEDTVDVTLTLTVPASRRHVLVFDPFPAGLEPLHASRADLQQAGSLDQRFTQSWQRSELHDTGLLLYAGRLEPGTYSYTYTLRAAAPGLFVRSPAHAEEMYTPEVFGRSGEERVEVRE